MNMTKTEFLSHLYYVVCFAAALGLFLTSDAAFTSILPLAWKPGLYAAIALLTWLKGQWNLTVNPDGTDARTAYRPEAPKLDKSLK